MDDNNLLDVAVIRELVEMHTWKRPSGSETERSFCAKWIDSLPNVFTDKAGNRIGVIGDDPVTMWSSHFDTVHRTPGMQKLTIGDGWLTVGSPPDISSCLGADCTVGVWLMRQMYLERVPGLYIWHYGEEVGGIGSRYIAEQTPNLLSGIQSAIAFDRRGETSVITHQFGERTASDAFGQSLIQQLNSDWQGAEWELDDSGVFTDTSNYSSIVPECSNISVGYRSEHSTKEALNLYHAYDLLQQMLDINEAEFVIARDPTVIEYGDWGKGYRWYGGNNPYSSISADPYAAAERDDTTLESLVRNYPRAISELLRECGFSYEEVRETILKYDYGRKVPY